MAPPGSPFRPLYDDKIVYSGQPVALVVAESFELARYAASLVRVEYESRAARDRPEAAAVVRLRAAGEALGISPAAEAARRRRCGLRRGAGARSRASTGSPVEHHNPMELHATTVVWEGDGKLTVHDKTQGVQNSQGYVTGVFGLTKDDVRVISPYVGGAFGSGLRPQYQLFLAVMAALELKRSVRVVLTRDQMFTFGHRPGHDPDARRSPPTRTASSQAIMHDAVAETSRSRTTRRWSSTGRACSTTATTSSSPTSLRKLDTYTPGDMRAPGATLGVFALEAAMDELAYATGVDPIELRLKNYAEKDRNEDKPFTSKELRACYSQGAERFGWSKRTAEPRSMREGRELIGWGMATGVWEAMMQQTSAAGHADRRRQAGGGDRDRRHRHRHLHHPGADRGGRAGRADRGRDGADRRFVAAEIAGRGRFLGGGLGRHRRAGGLPHGAGERCSTMPARSRARRSPISASTGSSSRTAGSRWPAIRRAFVTFADAMARTAGRPEISAEETTAPDPETKKKYSGYTHSAIFAEVRVDEELGVIRVTRIVDAVAAGKILNPKTARSQILGGVVLGIGMALHEESLTDQQLGRFMNHNLAEYHVPANADVHDIDVIFVDEQDDKASPIGVKGLGEIGIVGTAAAIANAIFHATGRRIRHLPITIDKVMGVE